MIDHPYVTNDMIRTGSKKAIYWKLVENEGDNKGYWERRENGDWGDVPNLFGPFENK